MPTPQVKQLQKIQLGIPSQIELSQVPFYPQTRYHCGPAAVSTLLGFHGLRPPLAEVVKRVYLPGRKGSLQSDMISVFRRYGYMSYLMAPRLRHLLEEVAAGRPVLILQNLGIKWLSRWHYAVVVGYDLDKQKMILRSGRKKRRIESFKLFERTWRRSGYWAIIVLKPGEMPANVDALRYLQAAAGMEQVKNYPAAIKAYTAAEKRWPTNLIARMGLANSYYASGDSRLARRKYRQITRLFPKAADAWNNLAYLMMKKNSCKTARRLVKRAILIGGRNRLVYRKTRKQIRLHCTR